jgi:HEPN domain-containing protein
VIPEASGATPVGIFMLANKFLFAAETNANLVGSRSDGPTRLLSYHACELFLKAFLRERGEDIETLRAYGHDLSKMLESAKAKGLLPSHQAEKAITRVVAKNDYVRARYMVTETDDDLSSDEVLRLTRRIRTAVRHALHLTDFGMPLHPPK